MFFYQDEDGMYNTFEYSVKKKFFFNNVIFFIFIYLFFFLVLQIIYMISFNSKHAIAVFLSLS